MEHKFTDANFEKEVLQAEQPVLVDFFAQWCGPCKMMAPIIEKLAEKYEGKMKIGKIDVDENPNMAAKYRVMSIPTLIFFKGGEKVEMLMGAMSESDLSNAIDKVLNN